MAIVIELYGLVAFLYGQGQPGCSGIRDLKNLTGMPPIAIIPILETKEIRRRRTIAWSFSVVGVASVLVLMIAIQV